MTKKTKEEDRTQQVREFLYLWKWKYNGSLKAGQWEPAARTYSGFDHREAEAFVAAVRSELLLREQGLL